MTAGRECCVHRMQRAADCSAPMRAPLRQRPRRPLPHRCAARAALPHSQQQPGQAPLAELLPHVLTANGDERADGLYWLADPQRTNPRVLAHLQAENRRVAVRIKGEG